MKKPWLALLLNLIPLPVGLGYLYLGRIIKAFAVFVLGWVVTLGIGVTAFFVFMPCAWGGDCNGILVLILLIMFFVVPLGFLIYAARDAWRIAKRINYVLGAR